MNFLKLTVCTTTLASDPIGCILLDAGSEGALIEDPADVKALLKSDVIWDYIDEDLLNGDKRVFVSGYFPENADLSDVYSALDLFKSRCEFDVGSMETSTSIVRSEDYENVWKKYYKPIDLGKVVIVPKWLKSDDSDKIQVFIDPGMAFGTGSHETTSMCIRLLNEIDLFGKSVCDLGCGSGILGITAAKCGAKSCVLSDIDPQAIEAATSNAALNKVEDKVTIVQGDLVADGQFDVVLANITADVLIRLSEKADKLLKKGGTLIISGIIHARADDVLRAYGGMNKVAAIKDGEWQAFAFKK